MVGGNWVTAYRGIDSYLVGKLMSNQITSPTTGRMKPEETQLDITHLPWLPWIHWMQELNKVKYGVQLGTAAAGTFNLNCSYLGIPCNMKIAFFTEGGYTGKVPRNSPNMRTDMAWICALNAVHIPIFDETGIVEGL